MERVAVIDFETTGMSPDQGARATEIGIALLEDGEVVDRYQSLMKTGARIPPFIEQLTGISNAMVRQAPPAERVMREAAEFVAGVPLIAHNASFDSKFWDAELARIGLAREQPFACSMLVARRVFPAAPSHKLGTLVDYAGLTVSGRFHRALADAEMTAALVARMCDELAQSYGLAEIPHALLRQIQQTPRQRIADCIEAFRCAHA
jgi:DNA polymerase-3 subunit epsilon